MKGLFNGTVDHLLKIVSRFENKLYVFARDVFNPEQVALTEF